MHHRKLWNTRRFRRIVVRVIRQMTGKESAVKSEEVISVFIPFSCGVRQGLTPFENLDGLAI